MLKSNHSDWFRLGAFILLFVLIFLLPFYYFVALLIVCSFIFLPYYEIVIFGYFLDLIYIGSHSYFLTLISGLILALLAFLRSRIILVEHVRITKKTPF